MSLPVPENIADYGLDSPEEQFDRDNNKQSDDQGSEKEPAFYVERIIDKRIENGDKQYRVIWHGYGEEDASWEPVENLYHLSNMIDDFERKLQKKKKSYLKDDDDNSSSERDFKHSSHKKQKMNNREGKTIESGRKGTSTTGDRKKIPETGHLRYRDKPQEIVSVRAMTEPGIFLFRVKWETRRTGEVPLDSYVSSDDFMKYNPRFLLAFYNSKIKFKHLEKGEEKKRSEKRDVWDSLESNLEIPSKSRADEHKEEKAASGKSSTKIVSFEDEKYEEPRALRSKQSQEKAGEEDFIGSKPKSSKGAEAESNKKPDDLKSPEEINDESSEGFKSD